MKYNEKYDRFVDDDLIIYRWDKKLDKLVQCKTYFNTRYMTVKTKLGYRKVHRVLWETMVGEIPPDYQLDHINTITTDNRLENLRCVTRKENMNNPITKINMSKSAKKRGMPIETIRKCHEANRGKPTWNAGLRGEEYLKHYKDGIKNGRN